MIKIFQFFHKEFHDILQILIFHLKSIEIYLQM